MPWLELFNTVLHAAGPYLAVIAILGGIIVYCLLYPRWIQSHKDRKKMVRLAEAHYASIVHPDRKDDNNKAIPIGRHELLLRLHDALDKMSSLEAEIIKLKALHCQEGCPVYSSIVEALGRIVEQDKGYLAKIIELRQETEKRIDANYDRVNEVMDTLVADKTAQMVEMNALFARMVVAIEKRS